MNFASITRAAEQRTKSRWKGDDPTTDQMPHNVVSIEGLHYLLTTRLWDRTELTIKPLYTGGLFPCYMLDEL